MKDTKTHVEVYRPQTDSNEYKKAYKGYLLKIPRLDDLDPKHCIVDVEVVRKDKQTLWGHFTTPSYLAYLLDKNERTGENLYGTYMAIVGLIVLREVTKKAIKDTIDDLIEKESLEKYLRA